MKKYKRGMHIPDEDHIVRHIPWNKLLKDDLDNVLGILPQSLVLRENENLLSVNWLEYFDGDHKARLRETKNAIASGKRSKKIGSKSYLAIGSITDTKSACEAFGSKVRIAYAPTDDNPAHSSIYHFPREDWALLGALANDVFTDLVKVGNIN